MKAFHNDLEIKNKYLNRVMAHAAADELIQGVMWENGKGCAIGCTLNAYDHGRYPIELGIPEWLAGVEDTIFEGLPKKDAKEWPIKFLAAIHVGADLEKVKSPFLIFVLESTFAHFDHEKFLAVKKAIDDVIALHKAGTPKEDAAWAVGDAARAAAWAAAGDAAWAVGDAARAAAWAAAGDAAWAARAAAWAARAAEAAAYIKFADHLLELLGSCK